jgi:hypothetical protein
MGIKDEGMVLTLDQVEHYRTLCHRRLPRTTRR